jgi:hypothetical protein
MQQSFDAIGYRLGIAQCDVVSVTPTIGRRDGCRLRARSLARVGGARELMNPRGEAACERLRAYRHYHLMILVRRAHASVAGEDLERLQDPWVTSRPSLLLAQVAPPLGDPQAGQLCSRVREDRPRLSAPAQASHARLARPDRGSVARDAATEIDRARAPRLATRPDAATTTPRSC